MIILFGAAGSGKSLQGQKLAEKYKWRWMSVGQLLRDCNDSELEKIMNKGELVSDEFVVNMMHREMMNSLEKGEVGILDGYPRDEWQAQWIVENGDIEHIDGAIILRVPHEELWKRLEARGRADDTKESIEKRWNLFETTIDNMVKILGVGNMKFVEVDGVGEIDVVTGRIEDVLREWGVLPEGELNG